MMDMIAFKTLKRPSSPNTYLLAPDGLCERATPDSISGVLPVSPTQLYTDMLDLIGTQQRWKVEASDEVRHLVHFVATTKLMRYKDDVDVMILPVEAGDPNGINGARIAVYSRSRVGHSDLGANRKRVTFMLESLAKIQKTA